MNKRALLTLAIPTYNRPETLEIILKALEKEQSPDFEILISDDVSPDGGKTQKLVGKYQKNIKTLHFHRNAKNLGFSGNVCQLYDMATTPYVWFLCDDDRLEPNVIEKVIDKLRRYDPSVAILSCTWTDPLGRVRRAGPEEDTLYNDIVKLSTYQPLMRMSFLSTLILKKLVNTNLLKTTDYKNNVFVQITLGLLILSKKFKLVELSDTVLYRHVGFKYGDFFKFHVVDHLRAISLIDHAFGTKKFIEWSIRYIPTFFLVYMSQKAGIFSFTGKPTQRTIKEIIKYYGIFSVVILLFMPIYMVVPAFIVRLGYKLLLYKEHGFDKGNKIYKEFADRARIDERKTEFTAYR